MFGLRGEVKCDPTPAGTPAFVEGALLHAQIGAVRETLRVASVRPHKGRLLIRFADIDDAGAAQRIVGATFFTSRDEVALEPDEYLDDDLVGCAVDDLTGRAYGRVERVEHHPANDMLIVAGRMLPLLRAFVRSIDVDAKRIVVDVPPGLLDDEAESDAPS